MNIWQSLERPIKVLAPMADYTDSAFRLLCRENGADMVITELISSDAIFYQAKNWYQDGHGWHSKKDYDPTLSLLEFTAGESPIIVQLFGKHPEKFAFAADWVSKNLQPEGIDINMGCPARKVVSSDHGAALLKDCNLAAEIVRAVKKNTNLPVSVKTRLGWDDDDEILNFAPKLIDVGVDALIIHGRTYRDGFKGLSRWENIYRLKDEFRDKVKIVGNGDIKDFKDIELKIGNLDGVAVGRGAFGKPWIFSRENVSFDELKKIILRHAELSFEFKGEHGIIEFRKHLLAYLKGFANAKELRKEAVLVKDLSDIQRIVEKL